MVRTLVITLLSLIVFTGCSSTKRIEYVHIPIVLPDGATQRLTVLPLAHNSCYDLSLSYTHALKEIDRGNIQLESIEKWIEHYNTTNTQD